MQHEQMQFDLICFMRDDAERKEVAYKGEAPLDESCDHHIL